MNAQGKSLGKQLSIWMPSLVKIAKENPGKVWFMGRDMDVFYHAIAGMGYEVRYMTGLNRDNAGKLHRRNKLESWLRSVGVRNGDIMIDSGYRGSIFQRIAKGTNLELYFLLLTADPNGATGVPVDAALNTEKTRHIILALEHSPKVEVCSWNEEKRRPRVVKLGGKEGETAKRFLQGCVSALKESAMKK